MHKHGGNYFYLYCSCSCYLHYIHLVLLTLCIGEYTSHLAHALACKHLVILTGYWAQLHICAIMSIILATTNLLPSSVPKLDPAGLNWTVFKLHFQDALDAKGYWGHFDGTSICPVASSPATQQEVEAVSTRNKNEHTVN